MDKPAFRRAEDIKDQALAELQTRASAKALGGYIRDNLSTNYDGSMFSFSLPPFPELNLPELPPLDLSLPLAPGPLNQGSGVYTITALPGATPEARKPFLDPSPRQNSASSVNLASSIAIASPLTPAGWEDCPDEAAVLIPLSRLALRHLQNPQTLPTFLTTFPCTTKDKPGNDLAETILIRLHLAGLIKRKNDIYYAFADTYTLAN